VDTAFNEAQRRGVGVTALLPSQESVARLGRWRQEYPDVSVRDVVVSTSLAAALVAESRAAALLVLPRWRWRHPLFRRWLRPRARTVTPRETSPVLLVPGRRA